MMFRLDFIPIWGRFSLSVQDKYVSLAIPGIELEALLVVDMILNKDFVTLLKTIVLLCSLHLELQIVLRTIRSQPLELAVM